MKRFGLFLAAVVLLGGVAGCGGNGTSAPTDSGLTLVVDTRVSVGGGGGWATIFFQGVSGKLIRITLTSDPALLPYGALEFPGGNSSGNNATYTPSLETAKNGSNTGEITLNGPSGQVTLTVFDGNNVGGSVRVQVWVGQ